MIQLIKSISNSNDMANNLSINQEEEVLLMKEDSTQEYEVLTTQNDLNQYETNQEETNQEFFAMGDVISPRNMIMTAEKSNTVVKKVIESDIKTELLGTYTVTAFCKCDICIENKVGKDIMVNYEGINVASNKNEIPFGTKIWIDGVGLRQTQPSGQKLAKNEIKVYFDTHEEVINFGVQEIEIYKILD